MDRPGAAEMVQLYTVNGGKPSARIPLRRYEAVSEAVLEALAKAGPEGLTLKELAVALAPLLPQWWFAEGWDTMWHVTGIKLHLEHLGQLERVRVVPHRVRLADKRG